MKAIPLIIVLVLFSAVLFGEMETSVELTSLASLTRDGVGNAVVALLGKGNLSFSAVNNPNVKAECELEGIWSGTLISTPNDILKRLFVKINLGDVYLTAGKTRVSFGEGFVFNAGDVIFGSMAPVADLAQALLRDQTDWLIDLSVPFGQFSFFEAILLPYSPLKTNTFPASSIYDLRGGGRVVTKLGGMKVEAGYLFRADEATHNPYISLQGNLFFDLEISATLKIPVIDYSDDKLRDGFAVTAGLSRIFTFEDSSTLIVRLETVLRPFGYWSPPTASTKSTHYGLLVYPEIYYAPLDYITFQLRAMINPIDWSGLVSFGFDFGIYQGLNLLGYVWSMWGDGSDPWFGWGRYGDTGVSLGFQFIY